jgi:hypothetical protein
MRPKYTKVRARSANEGSGTVGWSLVAPVPACFLIEEEGIALTFWQFKGNQPWSKGGDAREVTCGARLVELRGRFALAMTRDIIATYARFPRIRPFLGKDLIVGKTYGP